MVEGATLVLVAAMAVYQNVTTCCIFVFCASKYQRPWPTAALRCAGSGTNHGLWIAASQPAYGGRSRRTSIASWPWRADSIKEQPQSLDYNICSASQVSGLSGGLGLAGIEGSPHSRNCTCHW